MATKSRINWPPERAIIYNLNMAGKSYIEVPYNEPMPQAEYEAKFGGAER